MSRPMTTPADGLRIFRNQGVDPSGATGSVIGYNYRMTNIPGAIGWARWRTSTSPGRPAAAGALVLPGAAPLADVIDLNLPQQAPMGRHSTSVVRSNNRA